MENQKQLTVVEQVKVTLAKEYQTQIKNFFGDQERALRFLSSVMDALQRTPGLQRCSPASIINAFMIMASLKLMPSAISGEAYVLPYENKKTGEVIAQFQLGYQGLITLLYRAGVRSVTSEIVRKSDKFSIVNGEMVHEINPFMNMKERGEAIGGYTIINLEAGKVAKFMHADDIMAHGKRFSKSFGTSFSPWNASNDPELWMWRKTVLKQAAKLAPKNEDINRAIAADNEDSVISDRLKKAKEESEGLNMGALMSGEESSKSKGKNKTAKKNDETKDKENQGEAESASEDNPQS